LAKWSHFIHFLKKWSKKEKDIGQMVSLYPLFKKVEQKRKRYWPNGLTFILIIFNLALTSLQSFLKVHFKGL